MTGFADINSEDMKNLLSRLPLVQEINLEAVISSDRGLIHGLEQKHGIAWFNTAFIQLLLRTNLEMRKTLVLTLSSNKDLIVSEVFDA